MAFGIQHQWWRGGERYCSGCDTYMDPSCFRLYPPQRNGQPTKHGRAEDGGLAYRCLLCESAHNRDDYDRRKAVNTQRSAEWKRTHPQRARAIGRRATRGYKLRQRMAAEMERLDREERAG